ncbi:helix-turn-helix domain-containing protein [Streptomyces adustus]|uniref:helix-turn-helix domain-containing protein n=1 Tax=Streptomyces adustus TaxID=1609272 RepID=UPI003717BA43
MASGERWAAAGLPPESFVVGPVPVVVGAPEDLSLRGRGLTIREIAGLLGRAPSTVSRELQRNSRTTTADMTPTRPAEAANGSDVPDAPSCPRIANSEQRFSTDRARRARACHLVQRRIPMRRAGSCGAAHRAWKPVLANWAQALRTLP